MIRSLDLAALRPHIEDILAGGKEGPRQALARFALENEVELS